MSTTESEVRQSLGARRAAWWPWLVVLAVGLAIGGWWVARGSTRRAATTDWTTAPVERGTLALRVTAVGSLEPSNAVSIGTELSGIVAAVHVDANDAVKTGQVLAELDTELLRAQERQARANVDAAEASLASALATVEAAAADLDRARRLAASGTVSKVELDRASTAHRQAVAGVSLNEAQRSQARAAWQAANTSLEKARIVSPIDGVVLERSVEVGQAVVSSLQAATLFRVAEDLHQMTVDVEVDEADIGRIKVGQEADFTVAAHTDRVFVARVSKVNLAPTGTSDVVTYIATLTLENPDLALLPGMTATASITAETFEGALLVPNAALRFSPDGADLPPPAPRGGRRVARVWALDGDEPTPVEVLPKATDGRFTVVEEDALVEGALLVTGGGEKPRKGGAAP